MFVLDGGSVSNTWSRIGEADGAIGTVYRFRRWVNLDLLGFPGRWTQRDRHVTRLRRRADVGAGRECLRPRRTAHG